MHAGSYFEKQSINTDSCNQNEQLSQPVVIKDASDDYS